MTEFTISDMERTTANRGILSTDMQDISTATVTVPGEGSFHVSRWHDEPHWVIDALFREGSLMPMFSNGTGSRVTTPRGFTSETEIGAALDARLTETMKGK